MKIAAFFALILSTAPVFSAQSQYVTASGEIYRLHVDAPKALQPAFLDQRGLIWGDVHRQKTTVLNAQAFCTAIHWNGKAARLPTRVELIGLLNSMSRSPAAGKDRVRRRLSFVYSNPTFDLTPPALPNLDEASIVAVDDWTTAHGYLVKSEFLTFDGHAQVSGHGPMTDWYGPTPDPQVDQFRCVIENH